MKGEENYSLLLFIYKGEIMETVKQNKQLMEIWDTEENKKQNIFPENISLGSSKIKMFKYYLQKQKIY